MRPSGCLPSLRERPAGSFKAGIPAETRARVIIIIIIIIIIVTGHNV